jgi:hypothetical protein
MAGRMADAAANLLFIVFPVPEPSEDCTAHKNAEFLEQTGFVAVRHGLSPRPAAHVAPATRCTARRSQPSEFLTTYMYDRDVQRIGSRRERVDKQRFFFPTFFSEIDVL